ncbi:MAG: nuclear transport factor 2 family protein [Microthrixaceae bacterium]
MTDPTHSEHPARAASQRSMAAVAAGDRAAWLALFADDAVVEDPIGPSMFDPDGLGHRGRDAIGAFFDTVIGPNRVAFDIRASYACGGEVANVGTITTTLPDGSRAVVEGVYTYRVNEAGQLTALRAYWEADAITFEPASA